MLKWLTKLNAIIGRYYADLRATHARIDELEKLIRDRTNIAVDVGFKSASHVIVIGRYRNADYIQTFEMDAPDLRALIDQLRDYARNGVVRRVDAPPVFRAVFERDLLDF